jgi:N-acetylmuramate 1-kinase
MAISRDVRLSSDREALKADFLAGAGFGDARREPLAGDASTRNYERLHTASRTSLIFMDQPPSAESAPCPPEATPEERRTLGYNALARLAAGRIEAFVCTATYLRSRGLSAPEIFAADPTNGLAVLEDLGDDLYARLMEDGALEAPLYDAAIDTLSLLHAEAPPAILNSNGCAWPLLDYDETALKTAGDLFVEWAPRFIPSLDLGSAAAGEWEALWTPIRKRGAEGARVFCHRDYHAENLIWLPDREGPARVGLLDFQDALRAHPVWDLSMLLHDARRDVSREVEAAALRRYFKLNPQADEEQVRADYAALGALNVVRILGIFSRLVTRDGKTRYAGFMPRMWEYLDRCLEAPGMAGLADWMARYVPAEARV